VRKINSGRPSNSSKLVRECLRGEEVGHSQTRHFKFTSLDDVFDLFEIGVFGAKNHTEDE